MATTMQCDIVSAEAQIYSGAVELLVATGIEGELGMFWTCRTAHSIDSRAHPYCRGER